MKELFIITGATGGMGQDAARYFCKKGKLLLLDLYLEELKNIQNKLNADIDILKFDITSLYDINEVVNYVKDYGGFNYLLHFAGISGSMGSCESIYKINLIGNKLLLDSLYDYVRPGGVIINTSSMAGHITPIDDDIMKLIKEPLKKTFLKEILTQTKVTNQAYGWSKKGVIELTKMEGAKWSMKKARIISISPGAIQTPMLTKEMKKNQDAINQLIDTTPMKRIGTTKDIINLVAFLISDKSSFITGTDILIDGGATEVFKKYQ